MAHFSSPYRRSHRSSYTTTHFRSTVHHLPSLHGSQPPPGTCFFFSFSPGTLAKQPSSEKLKMAVSQAMHWQWENAAAGSAAGFATVTFSHPLDVVRTRFQVNDGQNPHLPSYKNTRQALFTIARSEGLRGLYGGFYPAVLGSTISWGLYFYFYSKAKQRYMNNRDELSPGLHLASAAEAGGLVCLLTNPVWLVKTRLQLQTPQQFRPYSGFHDALKTVVKDEGWKALYKGLAPGLILQVTHGAIQFTAYEELRKVLVNSRFDQSVLISSSADLLTTMDYATIGASSKLAAILVTYPFQVIRARLQQRPGIDGVPRYMDSWHAFKKTAQLEGVRGFYKGMTANLMKNLPSASLTFVVYETILNMLTLETTKD